MSRTKTKEQVVAPPDDAPQIEWAQWHASYGRLTSAWRVFRLCPGGKRPFRKGWQKEATNDPETIEGWWKRNPHCNIGLAIQGPETTRGDTPAHGHVAVDVDDKAALVAFEGKHEKLPATYQQLTPRGGFHLVYATELDPGNSTGSLPDGIDIRGQGGYIVGAGSVLADGRRWTVMDPSFPPVELPEWFAGHLTERRASRDKPRQDYGEPIDWDTDVAQRLVKAAERGDVVKDYEGAFAEGERDNLTFQLFALAKNHFIHPDVMLAEVLGSGIDGGLDDDQPGTVERKLQSAYHDGNTQEGYGSEVPAYYLWQLFLATDNGKSVARPQEDPVKWKAENKDKLPTGFPWDHVSEPEPEPGNDDDEPDALRVQSFAELLKKDFPPVVDIISGRIEKGLVNFLCGAGGVHKSRLTTQYGLSVQANVPVFGNLATLPGVNFVYVSAEDPDYEVFRRSQKIIERLELPVDAMSDAVFIDRYRCNSALATMCEGSDHKLTPFYYQLADEVSRVPGHKLVALDSCYDFVRFAGNAKINEDSVNAFIKEVLGGFCRDTNSTLLIPWHPSYAGQERGDSSGWSVAWHNAARVRDAIKKVKDADCFELSAEKRNSGPLLPPLRLYYSRGALVPQVSLDMSEQKAEVSTVCAEVAILWAEKSLPIKKQAKAVKAVLDMIEERLGFRLSNAEVKDILNRLVMDGRLKYMDGTGRRASGYYPPDQAEEMAREAKKSSRRNSRKKQ